MVEKLQCFCCEAVYGKGSGYDAGFNSSGNPICVDCEEGIHEAELEEVEDDLTWASEDEKVKILLRHFKALSDRDKQVFLKLTA